MNKAKEILSVFAVLWLLLPAVGQPKFTPVVPDAEDEAGAEKSAPAAPAPPVIPVPASTPTDAPAPVVATAPMPTSTADSNSAEKTVENYSYGTVRSYYGRAIKFGGRIAYNNSYVPGLCVTEVYFDMPTAKEVKEEHYNKLGFGSGIEIGGLVDIRLYGPLSLNAGLNFAFRMPVVTDAFDISEMAVGVPVLLRLNGVVESFYADIGVQADIPFGAKMKWAWADPETFDARSAADIGVAIGLGYNFMENIAVEIRGVIGVMPFDKDEDKPIYQINIGVGCLY